MCFVNWRSRSFVLYILKQSSLIYNGFSLMLLYKEWSFPDAVFSLDSCLQGCGGFWKGVWFIVRKRAKIRNRYSQAPHLTQNINGKVTSSQFHSQLPREIMEKNLHCTALEVLSIIVCLRQKIQRAAAFRFLWQHGCLPGYQPWYVKTFCRNSWERYVLCGHFWIWNKGQALGSCQIIDCCHLSR